MYKTDAQEAEPICTLVLTALLEQSPVTGINGSQLRSAVGVFLHSAEAILIGDEAGPYLENIFRLAQANGITLTQMDYVRGLAAAQNATTPGGTLIRDSLVLYCLAAEGTIISLTTFVSRDDVEAARVVVRNAFAPMEETIADGIDPNAYLVLMEYLSSIFFHLTQTAMPLPRMINYQFEQSLPSLVIAYRLYADASRADELRDENHVIHPAFMKPTGRALSK
jgi:hypothetical protein